MTAYVLSETRLNLERARSFLQQRGDDTDARELLGVVGDVIAAIGVAEVSAPDADRRRILAEGRAVYERVRLFAAKRKLAFLAIVTPAPPPRYDTDHALDTAGILAAIAGMKPGAEAPPAEIVPALREAVEGPEPADPDPRDAETIPAPPDTQREIPVNHPSPPPASFRTFSEDDDEED